jgi:16S rRNA G966 N2-methylase RsmD
MTNIGKRQLKYSDLDIGRWRDYEHIETGSLWMFNGRDRDKGHQLDYHGNCVPQILTQLLTRFTKERDVILDLFVGSGTSVIEAANLGREGVGVDIQPQMVAYVEQKLKEQLKHNAATLVTGDSSNIEKTTPLIQKALARHGREQAQFLFLHPPYADIIQFSDLKEDLSTLKDTDVFLDHFENVCRLGYNMLEPGRYAALVIGDKYTDGELIPLGFQCMERMNRVGFRTKSVIVKNITGNERGKGRLNNLWRYRALAGGFYIFKHEYVIVFDKQKK